MSRADNRDEDIEATLSAAEKRPSRHSRGERKKDAKTPQHFAVNPYCRYQGTQRW